MSIVRFDHSVLLVGDEQRARDFYLDALGASVHHTFVQERVPGNVMHRSLLRLNNIGHGLALYEDRIKVPPPKGVREFATVVFRVSPDRYDRMVEKLEGIEEQPPINDAGITFYTHDCEGNPIGFSQGEADSESFMLRLELDTSRLEEAITFYEEIFGLSRPEVGTLSGEGRRPYAWFGIGRQGQGVLVVEDSTAPSANVGHHFGFLLEPDEHLALRANLLRVREGDSSGHEGDRLDGETGTYVMDPGGRKLKWTTRPETS